MAVINQYSNESEAYIDCGMLRANGIDAQVMSDAQSLIFPAPGSGTGSISLEVPDSRVAEAKKLLFKDNDK